MDKKLTTITWLRGEKKLAPIEYKLTKRTVPGRFWFSKDKTEYCIVTQYATIFDFKSKQEAYIIAGYGGIKLIDCTGEE
jgi:hypothetical protein